MSVCGKTSKYIGQILIKKYSFLSGLTLLHSELKLADSTSLYPVTNRPARNIYTSQSLCVNISFNLTDIGEGIREVAVKEWFVKVGDRVSQFDNICEVQSDKASVTITSRYDGVITKLYYDIDAIALVGQPLVDIETVPTEKEEISRQETLSTNGAGKVEFQRSQPINLNDKLCIPSVRRLAKQNNVHLVDVKGTGKNGRVLKEDILNYLQSVKSQNNVASKMEDLAMDIRVEAICGFKKAMVKSMNETLKIPHFLYCEEIAITKLSQIRKSLKKTAEESGVKLTLLPFFIKAVSNALTQFPILNASVDEKCEHIIYKNVHNIGIAMNTHVGLAVPVIKNAQKLSILEIASYLHRLMKSGKQGTFAPDDLAGGTFTVSNIGAIGGTYAAPLLQHPQVAIIALGASKTLPRFDCLNNIIAEEIINISAAADHRIVDGATMASFINVLKKQIENPYLLLLHT